MHVIQVNQLSKSYADVAAVRDISFSVQQGQCFGLLGPNGAGKTTTIEMLEGLLSKDAGEILYYGQPINARVLEKVGIQFQHTALQDFLTVAETLEMFRAFYHSPLSIQELLSICHLEGFSRQDHRTLSGGQRQRLMLALALVNDPDILFLDEPTTGLDPQARRDFWSLISDIKSRGKSIVLTTHYMDEAEQLCDAIVVMERGKIIEQGAPKTLLLNHFPGVQIRLVKQQVKEEVKKNLSVSTNADFIEIFAQDIQSALQLLLKNSVDLTGMQVRTANLDDLFLKLTGHGLRADD